MASEYGGKPASRPGNGYESNSSDSPITQAAANVSRLLGSSEITLDDVIAMHIIDCSQCREVSEHARPVALGQKSGHCDAYWQLQLMRAEFEGRANNIVAYTEYGDAARKGGPLE
jgi:hypothetical protein